MFGRIFGKRQELPQAYKPLQEELVSAITKHGLFTGLPRAKLEMLFPACHLEEFKDDEIHCRCPPELAHHDAFLVLSGTVAIKYRRREEEHVLELGGFGTLFKVGNLVDMKGDEISARALGQVRMLMMDCEKLLDMFAKDPVTGYAVVRNLCRLLIEQHKRHLELILP